MLPPCPAGEAFTPDLAPVTGTYVGCMFGDYLNLLRRGPRWACWAPGPASAVAGAAGRRRRSAIHPQLGPPPPAQGILPAQAHWPGDDGQRRTLPERARGLHLWPAGAVVPAFHALLAKAAWDGLSTGSACSPHVFVLFAGPLQRHRHRLQLLAGGGTQCSQRCARVDQAICGLAAAWPCSSHSCAPPVALCNCCRPGLQASWVARQRRRWREASTLCCGTRPQWASPSCRWAGPALTGAVAASILPSRAACGPLCVEVPLPRCPARRR